MHGFITYCFSDWQSGLFQRGVMQIKNGTRNDTPIRRPLKKDELENRDYYIKADPNFALGIYGVCHRKLRKVIQLGDVLFFRTLWRGQQYIIGYFLVERKDGTENNPILIADLKNSQLIHFTLPITLDLAQQINPDASFCRGVHHNVSINGRLGRNYKRIDEHTTHMLMDLMKETQSHLVAA